MEISMRITVSVLVLATAATLVGCEDNGVTAPPGAEMILTAAPDIVIIDSPPVLAVTDAIIAGKMSDGVLLCFRAGKVLREDARACRDQLQLAGVRILGSILNCYQPATTGKYDRRYYYHYTYEGYASDEGEAEAGTTAA